MSLPSDGFCTGRWQRGSRSWGPPAEALVKVEPGERFDRARCRI